MSDAEPKSKDRFQHRDAEMYIAIGIFVFAVGLPVLIGTMYALESPRAAVVNAVCGVVLILVGLASTGYGWLLLLRHRKTQ